MLVQFRYAIYKSQCYLEVLDIMFIDYLAKAWRRLTEIRYFMMK